MAEIDSTDDCLADLMAGSLNISPILASSRHDETKSTPCCPLSSSHSKIGVEERYGDIFVDMVQPVDMFDRNSVTGQLKDMLRFFCHSSAYLQTMKKKIITEFWNLHESRPTSFGAKYMNYDLPQLRMNHYDEDFELPACKTMTTSDLRARKRLNKLLNELKITKFKVCHLKDINNQNNPKVTRSRLHGKLTFLLVYIFMTFYDVDIRGDTTMIYSFKVNGHEIETNPDMVIIQDETDFEIIPIEVCSLLQQNKCKTKSENTSIEVSSTYEQGKCDSKEQKSIPSSDVESSVTTRSKAAHPVTNKDEHTSKTHGMKLRSFSYSSIDDTSSVNATSSSELSLLVNTEGGLYLSDPNSRPLPDVLKNMSLDTKQIEYIRRKIYGQMINHLMACISDSFRMWHTGKKNIVPYKEEDDKFLLNAAWGFFVLHEIAIPVKLYCPLSYAVKNFIDDGELHKLYVTKKKYTSPLYPRYSVFNWHLDLSTQAGRRAFACFLKYSEYDIHVKKSDPYASI